MSARPAAARTPARRRPFGSLPGPETAGFGV
jgi:hypothetical protein